MPDAGVGRDGRRHPVARRRPLLFGPSLVAAVAALAGLTTTAVAPGMDARPRAWSGPAVGVPARADLLRGPEARWRSETVVRPDTLPVVDTVVVVRENVFSAEESASIGVLRLLNRIHVTTRPWVVRQEVLLEPGMSWDSAKAAETERNLRARRLFRRVRVDSARVDGRLAAVVRTADAWSLLPRLQFEIAADGTLTGTAGGTELNFLGTGTALQAWYVREVDRAGLALGAGTPRLGRTPVGVQAGYQTLSDRTLWSGTAGLPYRALEDRRSFLASVERFDGRVLQYRVPDPTRRDTVRWTRRAATARLAAGVAPVASTAGYLRLGAALELRREELFPRSVSGALVPDTLYGLVAASVDWRRAEFRTVRRLNGYTPEDQDLSGRIFFSLALAPGAWGWERTGVGLRVSLAEGTAFGAGSEPAALLKARVDAGGLLDGNGLDSGRVVAAGMAALIPAAGHATFLEAIGGALRRPAPGREFDLGFGRAPRLWEPHAFVGTRMARLTLEHRWYAAEDVLRLLGLGLGAFADYGGAWYPEQDPRLGGNLGVALLLGSSRSPFPQVAQLAVGWRFGGGLGGTGPGSPEARREPSRWAIALLAGPVF